MDLYERGHIPGASLLDLDNDLSGPPGIHGRHPLPAADDFVSAAGRAGIGDDVSVVAYGGAGAYRLWWLLKHFGFDDCAILDFVAWRGPLAVGVETPDEWIFTPRPSPPDTIELTELHERLEELVIVDARLPSRWRGEPNAVDRIPGRIPGALNAPWTEELPMLPDGETVVYCGSGVTACAALFRMEAAGRPARLYVGSWSEWEQHPELPIERS